MRTALFVLVPLISMPPLPEAWLAQHSSKYSDRVRIPVVASDHTSAQYGAIASANRATSTGVNRAPAFRTSFRAGTSATKSCSLCRLPTVSRRKASIDARARLNIAGPVSYRRKRSGSAWIPASFGAKARMARTAYRRPDRFHSPVFAVTSQSSSAAWSGFIVSTVGSRSTSPSRNRDQTSSSVRWPSLMARRMSMRPAW